MLPGKHLRWAWRAGSLLLLAAGLIHAAAVLAQTSPSPLPVKDYWQLLQETRTLIGYDDVTQKALSAAADRLDDVTAVRLNNGQTIPVDHAALTAHLRADPPNLNRLKKNLDAQLAAFDAWPQFRHNIGDIDPLNQILSRPEFQWPEQQPPPWQAWLDRLLQRLQAFFQQLRPTGSGGSFLGNLLLAVGALALAAVLFFSLRGFLADLVTEAKITPDGMAGEDSLTAETALQRAQNLSNGGDYRTAVRYLYLSSLLLLEERGLLRYDRARTNREYLRSIAGRPDLAAVLHDVIEVFDRVWYGFQPLDEAAYSHYAAQVRSLQRQK